MRIGSLILLKLSSAVYISALAGQHALNGAGTMIGIANRFYIPAVNDRKKMDPNGSIFLISSHFIAGFRQYDSSGYPLRQQLPRQNQSDLEIFQTVIFSNDRFFFLII